MPAIDLATATALIMLAALIVYAWFGGADYGAGVWDLLAAGPAATLRLMLVALGAGSLILLPSLADLFRIFKRHTISSSREDIGGR